MEERGEIKIKRMRGNWSVRRNEREKTKVEQQTE